jgi:ubiquinone/menaquinone biosynthesis C-methylase UbiE
VNEHQRFGDIDIYLFDQVLKGRIRPDDRVLDAGCGTGRNLVYLLRAGANVWGVDADADSIADVRRLAQELAPAQPSDRFTVAPVEDLPYPDGFFTVVLSSAVLHFARTDDQFERMLRSMWRVLASGGMLFARLASSEGIERQIQRQSDGRFRLPDGTSRYLVDEPTLTRWTTTLGGRLLDPLKTTIVHGQRSMTTWVVRKD